MQPEDSIHGASFGRLDQFGLRDGDRKERTIERCLPESQKIPQRRKIREQTVVLPT